MGLSIRWSFTKVMSLPSSGFSRNPLVKLTILTTASTVARFAIPLSGVRAIQVRRTNGALTVLAVVGGFVLGGFSRALCPVGTEGFRPGELNDLGSLVFHGLIVPFPDGLFLNGSGLEVIPRFDCA